MNSKLGALLAQFALLASLSQVLRAQSGSTPFDEVASAIARQQPKWKLERKRITSDNSMALLVWKSGKSSVGVFIIAYPSKKETEGRLEGLVSLWDLTVLSNEIANLGDKNLMWESKAPKERGVMFTKGRFVLSINADSIETAAQFAKSIAEVLPAS